MKSKINFTKTTDHSLAFKKAYWSLLILALLITPFANAQETIEVPTFPRMELGFRFMPTVSKFEMKTTSGGTTKGQATLGYGIGGMLAFNFNKHFGIQAELIYNSLTQKYKDDNLDREINVRYLNVPLLFSVNTGKGKQFNLNLVAGPQLGFNMGSKINRTGGGSSDTFTYVLSTKSSDLALAYGAGLEFMLNTKRTLRMDLGFRGVHGLININKSNVNADDGSVNIVNQAKIRTKSGYIGIALLF